MKIIEVITDADNASIVRKIAKHNDVADIWSSIENNDGRVAMRMLVATQQRQQVLDALQSLLQSSETTRILVLPIEVTLPKINEDKNNEDEKKKKHAAISREELFSQVEKGGQLDSNFILLVILSAVVAAIGMLENNVAVIVGAMVIAPLLGPNIAFSLGTSLGEKDMVVDALRAIIAGIALAVITGAIIGLLWPGDLASAELMLRTDAFYSGTAIALASGAAASLSLVTSTSSVLVGVMVAVALMPPAVTIGLMLSANDIPHALGAALLLAVNIVCINLSAKLVFFYRNIKPRTWLEARKARQSQLLYIAVWIILLALLSAMIYLRKQSL